MNIRFTQNVSYKLTPDPTADDLYLKFLENCLGIPIFNKSPLVIIMLSQIWKTLLEVVNIHAKCDRPGDKQLSYMEVTMNVVVCEV